MSWAYGFDWRGEGWGSDLSRGFGTGWCRCDLGRERRKGVGVVSLANPGRVDKKAC